MKPADSYFRNTDQTSDFIRTHKIRENMDSLDMDSTGHLLKYSSCGVIYRETISGIAFEVEEKKLAQKIQKLIFNYYKK